MPLYDYECRNCGHLFEAASTVEKRRETQCPKCCGDCQVLIRTRPGVIIFEPYNSPTFKRKVSSSREKRRLMDERGLEEYSTVDEVHAVAERNRQEKEKKEAERGPDERFYECYNKAKAMFPD